MKPAGESWERRDSWPEYLAIRAAYQGRRAVRSGVSYQAHVDEGLALLRWLGGSERAARAFCLHPLVQADSDLLCNFERLAEHEPRVVALALEYRRVANAALSTRALETAAEIELSPLPEVNDMLRADKLQNQRDFRRFQREHPRYQALERYFRLWLERLEVCEAEQARLYRLLEERDSTAGPREQRLS